MTICIYHGNCQDGFGAAWAVREALGDAVEFHPGVYGNAPPDVTGRDVLMVDFSYKRPALLEMASRAASILILDHHKTAQEDLAGFGIPPAWDQWAMYAGAIVPPRIACLFDIERSGAGLTWDYFNSRQSRPKMIDHIEDRDLWRFALPNTREISAALFSYDYDFNEYSVFASRLETHPQLIIAEGDAINRKHEQDIRALLPIVTRWMAFYLGEGKPISVPVANVPMTMTSDAGHALCKQHGTPFAACYWDTPEGRVFSLRSLDEGADVSAIAKEFGGGGHKHAAGFRAPFEKLQSWGLA